MLRKIVAVILLVIGGVGLISMTGMLCEIIIDPGLVQPANMTRLIGVIVCQLLGSSLTLAGLGLWGWKRRGKVFGVLAVSLSGMCALCAASMLLNLLGATYHWTPDTGEAAQPWGLRALSCGLWAIVFFSVGMWLILKQRKLDVAAAQPPPLPQV